jgi:hypothetical protein
MKKKPAKVAKVMREFKSGSLKSSSGQKVTNPKQAIAIGLSEAGMSKPKMKEGGMMKDSKTMMKQGGKVKKMAIGGVAMGAVRNAAMGAKKMGPTNPNAVRPGSTPRPVPPPPGLSRPQNPSAFPGVNPRGAMTGGGRPAPQQLQSLSNAIRSGAMKSYGKKAGGLAAGHKSADGVATKGKTKGKEITMQKGGAVKKMRYGGKC